MNILNVVRRHANNGTFKFGSYIYINNELQKLLPGSGSKAYPFINSKIRTQKKSYGVIFEILNTSDFGWNNMRKCVVVDKEEV